MMMNDCWLYFVCFFVGLSPWLPTSALMCQNPVFAHTLPEGNSVMTLFSVLVQIGNLPAFLVAYLMHRKQAVWSNAVPLFPTLLLCVAASLFAAVSWQWTSADGHHSVGCLTAVTLSGVCGCVAVMLVYPYAAEFRDARVTAALATGMGSNGLVASLIAIVQRPGQPDQLFSTTWFMAIITGLCVCSVAAMFLLERERKRRRRRRVPGEGDDIDGTVVQAAASVNATDVVDAAASINHPLLGLSAAVGTAAPLPELLVHETVNCFCGFLVLGLTSYPFRRFHQKPLNAALLLASAITWNVCYCAGRFLTAFVRVRSRRRTLWLMLLSASCLALAGLVLLASLSRPGPLFGSSLASGVGLVSVTSVFALINGFQEISLFQLAQTPRRSRAVALAQQTGALFGSSFGLFLSQFVL